jgi:hypothetical protein
VVSEESPRCYELLSFPEIYKQHLEVLQRSPIGIIDRLYRTILGCFEDSSTEICRRALKILAWGFEQAIDAPKHGGGVRIPKLREVLDRILSEHGLKAVLSSCPDFLVENNSSMTASPGVGGV